MLSQILESPESNEDKILLIAKITGIDQKEKDEELDGTFFNEENDQKASMFGFYDPML